MLYYDLYANQILPQLLCSCAVPEGGGGGQGVWTPLLKTNKTIGFHSKTDPDPLKITKLPSLDHHLAWEMKKAIFLVLS